MILLRTTVLEVDVLPEIGGKVAQIRHLESGRELLISPRRPYRMIPPDRPWVEYDTSGMDDCFPNVDEGPYPLQPWLGTQLPQMGEWVRGEWDVVGQETRSVTLKRAGSLLPYTADKRISIVDESTLQLSYKLCNTGAAGFSYIWSAHPLIAVRETFAVRLPGRELPFVTFPNDGGAYRWPMYRGVDLSHQWLPHGRTLKLFVCGLPEGWCELIADGLRFRFEFDLAANPVVGLWFNNYAFGGGGSPFRCIAVEPCTSPTDVLHTLQPGDYPFLAPGAETRWFWSLGIG